MRLVVIDTETTGLSPQNGDKIVEIGAVVIEQGQIQTVRTFHRFVDPQREIPPAVVQIHGIDAEKLAEEGARPFAEIGRDFLDFIAGATLVFHNARFDLGFIKKELADAGLPGIDAMPVMDTLSMARERFPKRSNNLDALCDRFSINRSHRALHGALIDATLTAHCFLAMSDAQFGQRSEAETSALPTHHVLDVVREVYHDLEQRHDQAENAPVPTGIPVLDGQYAGIQSGDILLIAGHAARERTTFSAGIVNRMAFMDFTPCSVVVFSLRHMASQWVECALGVEANVDASIMQSGHIQAEHWQALAAASGKMAEADIHICDRSPVSLQDMYNTCRQIDLASDRLVILVDDLQRVSSPEATMAAHTDFEEIFESFKNLAMELSAAIILLAELSASLVKDGNPLSEASGLQCLGSVDQESNIVLFIHRNFR